MATLAAKARLDALECVKSRSTTCLQHSPENTDEHLTTLSVKARIGTLERMMKLTNDVVAALPKGKADERLVTLAAKVRLDALERGKSRSTTCLQHSPGRRQMSATGRHMLILQIHSSV